MKKIEGFCPIRDIISVIGTKWAVLILLTIGDNTLHFSEIQRAVPDISQKMLTQELRALESFNLVSRKVYPEVPPKVEYRLTALGRSFMPAINGVIKWALENKEQCLGTK